MKNKFKKPAKGNLLISEPALYDYYFRQSIVLLAEHGKDGSFGLIINKPSQVKFNDIVKDFPPFDAPVYIGGPVKTDNLFVLHRFGNQVDKSFKVIDGLYWGGNIDIIKDMIISKKADPENMHFYLGFSSWAPKQLDEEMNRNSWIVTNAEIHDVFEKVPNHLWGNLIKQFGKDYAIWANSPPDPSLN